MQYYRLPLTDGEAPKETIFDVFYNHVKDVPPSDALIFNCQMGGGRTTTGMVIGCLIRMHTSGPSQSALLLCCVSADHRPLNLVDFCISSNRHRTTVHCGKPACLDVCWHQMALSLKQLEEQICVYLVLPWLSCCANAGHRCKSRCSCSEGACVSGQGMFNCPTIH